MTGPISNRIGAVFVPVRDLSASARWYSELLGVSLRDASHGGTIYDVPMQGDVALILDATRPEVTSSSQPLCFFWSEDIEAAHRALLAGGVEVVRGPEDIGSVTTLTFKDPDGNLLMACRRNERRSAEAG